MTLARLISATIATLLLVAAPLRADLIDDTLGLPLISFNGGTTSYDASSGRLTMDSLPASLLPPTGPPPVDVDPAAAGEWISLALDVDAAGNLVAGQAFELVGEVTFGGNTYSGVLLSGTVSAFGFSDSGGPTDSFDFRVSLSGGLLAGFYNDSIGIHLTSEMSNFSGSFTADFNGAAKGQLGKIPPILASLGDFVWEDLNADGIQDPGEPGVDGVTVRLFSNPDGDGACTSGDEFFTGRSTVTDANGYYDFGLLNAPALAPGDYCVEFVLPAGFSFSPQDVGADDKDSDADPVTGRTANINLDPGEHDPTWDAGIIQPLASLGDRAWEDLNANGVQDCSDSNGNGILGDVDPFDPLNPAASDQGAECGEIGNGGAGIPGVAVNLFKPDVNGDCTVDQFQQTVTGMDGLYLFENLEPGDYCVQFGPLPADFCDTGGFQLGAARFTTQNFGADETTDSDADAADGTTDPVSLASGETNRNLDAGYVCPAKIGNFVWEDVDNDGLQDAEPGVEGVVVELFECGLDGVAGTADDNNTGEFRVTDSDGMYMFGAEPGVLDLPPGDYYVKFDSTTFPPGYDFTTPKVGGDDEIDSDCLPPSGIAACATLGSRGINLRQDCGIVPPPPPVCDLEVDLLCRVEPQPSTMIGDKCEGKLQQFTLTWNGPGPVFIDSVNMGTTSTSGPIVNGDEVTFFGPYGSNDVEVQISGAVSGQSTFHVSCSDDNFNSPDDCGKMAGDGKGDDSDLLNLWLLEGFVDDNGDVLDCNPDPNSADFSQNCSFVLPPGPDCDSLGKPTSLTFEYTGGACPGDNDQGSKTDCSGSIDPLEMVMVSVDTSEDYMVTPSLVAPGETFTITRNGSDFRSNTVVELSNSGGTQVLEIHTSCSAPLATNDEFGAITLLEFDGQSGGADVTYKYVVTNLGDPLTDIEVSDDSFGPVGTIGTLGTNEMAMLTRMATVNASTTTVASANATLGGLVCMASDTVIVEELGPPPCEITPDEFKLDDDKIKWKLTNAGNDVATVESIEISAPAEFGEIDKVKLDGDIFKDDTRPMTWVFTAADFIGDLDKRQIKVGDTKELLFETTEKFKHATADQIMITVNFEEGCSVTFVPGSQPFECSDAKPIDSLSMIWNGPDGVDVMSPAGDVVNGVVAGQEVSFSGLSGMGNDVFWTINGAVNGSSKFHVSCSDDSMDGPEDCGGPLGDGKDDDGSQLNLWLFEGMAGTNGIGLDCSAL